MKTVMKRDFFRKPKLVRFLKPGEELAVTEHGQTDFVVVKSGRPARRTTEDLARLAARLLPGRRQKINVVAKLRLMRA